MKNRKDIIKRLNNTKTAKELIEVLNLYNSCDALWIVENMNKLSKKTQKMLSDYSVDIKYHNQL